MHCVSCKECLLYILIVKHYLLIVDNSNLTGYPVFVLFCFVLSNLATLGRRHRHCVGLWYVRERFLFLLRIQNRVMVLKVHSGKKPCCLRRQLGGQHLESYTYSTISSCSSQYRQDLIVENATVFGLLISMLHFCLFPYTIHLCYFSRNAHFCLCKFLFSFKATLAHLLL